MRITSKGQVTIPIEIRNKLGLFPNTEVVFVVEGKAVRIVRKKERTTRSRATDVLQSMRGSATVRMTTDEIMALTRSE